MAMLKDTLKATIKAYLTKTGVPSVTVDASGNVTPTTISVSPDETFLNAVTEIVPYIQVAAEVVGPVTITGASGGMVVGVGGGVPGPVTASLTGAVPVTGVATIPVTAIK